ncbi:polysaccharide deacetylase family protein [Eubacterium pyruvativorans]|uniref:polysaccharide deacetylase family protein n=1 Tax=Eubacterium pyruvativorans TaxID=155865 RepID=UPI0015692C05|nr:polysaccharide deacetylase family protein [Eubacterium pyruvativorans]
MIYLTFDDGPGARNTPRLLNLLKKYDAKATFFLVGTEVSAHPEIVRREFREGHTVAIHTYTHNYNQIYKNTSAFFRDFDRIEKQLTEITGQKPRFNRMPGGSNNAIVSRKNAKTIQRILRKKGYVCMDWNAATNDAVGIAYSTDTMTRYGMKSINAVRTPIVLIHDSDMKTKTVPVVKKLLEHYTKKGYSFEALDMYRGPAIQFTK